MKQNYNNLKAILSSNIFIPIYVVYSTIIQISQDTIVVEQSFKKF